MNDFVLECKKEPGFSPRSSLALSGIPHNKSIFLTKFSCFFIFLFFYFFIFILIQFVCFILPAAFALRLHSNERLILSMFERLAAWSLALGGFIVGVLSTYVTILEIVQG